MAKQDVIDDLVDLVHPKFDRQSVAAAVGPDGDPGDEINAETAEDAYAAVREATDQRRDELEGNLRAAQDTSPVVLASGEAPVEVDPLISEITRARHDQQEVERRLRLLLAYAREYTPRAYSLSDLAEASGMSVSGVRTAYAGTEIAELHARLRRGPRNIFGLRGEAGSDECAVITGKRNQPAYNCPSEPTTIGGAPNTDRLFHVCTAHAYLVSDPRPVTAAAADAP